jgi:Zn-dependent peptidase ImmA (M78 family)
MNNGIDKDGFISELAENISRYYWRKYGEIDPEVIAFQNRISFSYGNYGDCFDGMLEFARRKFHIYINTRGYSKDGRTKFTFGHELGHFYLPQHSTALVNNYAPAHTSFTGYKSNHTVEKEADHFSANLLMPYERLIDIYRKRRKFSFDTIVDIKIAFGVSQLAALYRVLILELHPIVIVQSSGGKITDVNRNKGFYFKLNDKLPSESLAYRYFQNRAKSEGTESLWLMDWFDTEDTRKMFEHCIYYDSINTVYSVLWMD